MKRLLLQTLIGGLMGSIMAVSGVPAEAASGLNLESLIQEALEKNPAIQAAQARSEAYEARIDQVTALDDPELGFDTWNIPSDLDLSGTRNWIFFLRQRFPFPGTRSLRGEVAGAMSLERGKEYEAIVQEITAEVKIAYSSLYLAHKVIEVTQENTDILRRFEKIAQVKYATGTASQQDVLKVQIELARLANDLITLEQTLKISRARLNTLLNRTPRSPMGRPDELVLIDLPEDLESLRTLALRQRPGLRATQAAITRSRHEIALAKLKFYPDFQVGVKRFQNQGIPQPNGWGVSASINVPWFFHRKHDQRLIEAEQQLSGREALHEALENETRFSIEDLLVKIETAGRLAYLYQNSLLLRAKQAVQSADIGYRTDRMDFLNLLESQHRLEEFKLEYYRALTMQNQGVARLEQILGRNLSEIKKEQTGGTP